MHLSIKIFKFNISMIIFILMFMKYNMFISFKFFEILNISIDFMFNNFNNSFFILVMLIFSGIKLYLKVYFNFKNFMMFNIFLKMFILSMMMLIFSNNFISLIIGWDGLGISSYYLVSFYMNKDSMISSVITFFFNRLGDSLIILSLSMIMNIYSEMNLLNLNFFMIIMIILGLSTKSAQLPFGVWLPLAMSAPTPISSLVHSSTLVTSGILIIMKNNILMFFISTKILIIILGIMTFFLGSIFSFFSLDFKKAIAFSTMSQMGFIFFSMSMSMMNISLIHLMIHALFKSSLFINMGMIMIYNNSIQDYRLMNYNSSNMFFKLTFIISCFNLMGLIFSSGFLSKDLILLMFFNNSNSYLMMFLMFFGCLFSCCYSLKFILIISNFYSLKMMKLSLKKEFSFFFYIFLLFSLMLFFIPMLINNFLLIDLFYLSLNLKFLFYLMIFLSFIILKLVFKILNFFLFILFEMIMILNNFLNLISSFMNHIINFILNLNYSEEFIQMNLFIILSKLSFKNLMYFYIMKNEIFFMFILFYFLFSYFNKFLINLKYIKKYLI